MPELPEVETIKRGLEKLLKNRLIVAVNYDNNKSFPNDPGIVEKFLIGSKITEVKRRGKVIIIGLSSRYSLIIHLKMTGQLIFRGQNNSFGGGHPTQSLVGLLPDRSTRSTLIFDDDSKLFFNDQRKFGWMKLLPTTEIPNIDFFKKIGPEPLEPGFTWTIFNDRLNRRINSLIKPVLLDQTIVAGIGNIYADESLWLAKIHPETRVKYLTVKKIRLLYKSIKDVLELSIQMGGSTDRNYVNAEGRKGNYLDSSNVFRRQGQPCKRCGTIIIKLKVNGRGTHICPKEQRLIE